MDDLTFENWGIEVCINIHVKLFGEVFTGCFAGLLLLVGRVEENIK